MIYYRKAILIIHGFAGGIYDNEDLLNYLQLDSRLDVFTFTLPGHERKKMKNIKYQTWIDESENRLIELFKHYKDVYIIGHSMGGVIATVLANKYKSKIKKLILLAPAFNYYSLRQNKKDIGKVILFIDLLRNKKEYNGYQMFIDNVFNVSFSVFNEFRKLIEIYKYEYKNIQCDFLIMHGDKDEIVPVDSSIKIYKSINNPFRGHLMILKDVRHAILKSNKKKEAFQVIYKFLLNKNISTNIKNN